MSSLWPEPQRRPLISGQLATLIALERNPQARLYEVADFVGVDVRQVQRYLNELEKLGLMSRTRVGSSYEYVVHRKQPLPAPWSRVTAGRLLDVFARDSAPGDADA